MLLMCQEGPSPALLVFDRVFTDRAFRRSLCETCTNPSVIAFGKENAEKVGGEASLANVTPYITCKVSPIIQSGFLAQVLGAPRDLLQLDRRLDERGIILVNLNKGMLGARCSRLLGSMLTMQLFAAGLKRSLRRRDRRPPVNVYIDEFQNFVSDNIAEMFSEARKFGLRLHVANQHLGQLQDRSSSRVLDAILGNVGNMILFRLGVPDSGRLEEFSDPFTARQMQELPNYHALTRLLTPEGPIRPFVMKTLPVEA
ncbi:MAG: TraM recognition domain-containing protein [Kiritimatiellae bacterium]|nr:TraM recognition domain-containing protein [Kiritimatiellia bacterium]